MKYRVYGKCIATYTGSIEIPDNIRDEEAIKEYVEEHLDEVNTDNLEYSADMPYKEDNIDEIEQWDKENDEYDRD